MQIPSVSSMFSAKLRAVGFPVRSDTGFADSLSAAAAEASQQDSQDTQSSQVSQSATASLGGVYYTLVPNVHYTLQTDAIDPTSETQQVSAPDSIAMPDVTAITDAAASSSLGGAMAAYAKQFVGNPYVWGGEDPVNGTDCSGFTQTIYKTFGMSLPRTAYRQSLVGREVSMDELQPGDLLCFQNEGQTQVGHVGMYLGDGKFIQAANSKLGIITSDLSKWTDRLKTIRRLPELEPAVG